MSIGSQNALARAAPAGAYQGFLSTTFFASSASAARSISSAGTSITSSKGGRPAGAGREGAGLGAIRAGAGAPDGRFDLTGPAVLAVAGTAARDAGAGRGAPVSAAPRSAGTVGGRTHSVT